MIRLTVQRIERTCLFELSWGRGQQLRATLNYPELLTVLYQDWQRAYISYYNTALRGRVESSGSMPSLPIDWHAKLVQAEARLLYEFHQWLRSPELFEIRSAIAHGAGGWGEGRQKRQGGQGGIISSFDHAPCPIDVFLTCAPLDVARLPWEAWEIGAEFANGAIRIVRVPVNIRAGAMSKCNHHGKFRILVILGDDKGLNFAADCLAVRSLNKIATIEFLGWQPGCKIEQLKVDICNALASPLGWDVLLFAGHSNESEIVGGELAIAPGTSLGMNEIKPHLLTAISRGLQFALFNSCSGINIAESLIDLGLSQVAVMREPIRNDVAQEFLGQFLQQLAAQQDVPTAMLKATGHLKLVKNLTYPSASLVPSLFCHPDAEFFRFPPPQIKQVLKQLAPTRKEGVALLTLTLLSLHLPVQDWLLEKRVLVQAVYRHLTQQVPTNTTPPPVLLVQIDEKSIREAKISYPKPMNRQYLARLVNRLKSLEARVVGIDYLLDRPQVENDSYLAQALQTAVQKPPYPTWFVFASDQDNNQEWLKVLPSIASSYWSLSGHIYLHHWNMQLVSPENYGNMQLVPEEDYTSPTALPFAYHLALAYRLNFQTQNVTISPQLQSSTDFFFQVTSYLKNTHQQNYKTFFGSRSQLQPITSFSYYFSQMWFHPIVDFSIPIDRVYKTIPAWKILSDNTQAEIGQQVVIVAPGGYGEAGIAADGEDNSPLPPAVSYWLSQSKPNVMRSRFTGGEAHAYMVHHFLSPRLVVPYPDFWLVGVAVLLGITRNFVCLSGRRKWAIFLSLATVVYGVVSLQVYITAAVLLPWFLPSVTLWIYILPGLLPNSHFPIPHSK
jgi:hypothetical protein